MSETQIEEYRSLIQKHDAEKKMAALIEQNEQNDKNAKLTKAANLCWASVKAAKAIEEEQERMKIVKRQQLLAQAHREQDRELRERERLHREDYVHWRATSGMDKFIYCIFQDMREHITDLIRDECPAEYNPYDY